MTKLSLRDLDVRGKRVLVRVDFNVPTGTARPEGRIRRYADCECIIADREASENRFWQMRIFRPESGD